MTSEAFTARLGNLLRAQRRESRTTLRHIARASGGRFTKSQLRAAEAGTLPLEGVDVGAMAALYGADIDQILPDRLPLTVDLDTGLIMTGGVRATFVPGDEQSLFMSYLRLVRDLRGELKEPTVALRRHDIETLSEQLRLDGAVVVERLGEVMGATVTQRRAMSTLFLAGAAIVVLTTGAVAMSNPPAKTGPGADGGSSTVATAPAELGPIPLESADGDTNGEDDDSTPDTGGDPEPVSASNDTAEAVQTDDVPPPTPTSGDTGDDEPATSDAPDESATSDAPDESATDDQPGDDSTGSGGSTGGTSGGGGDTSGGSSDPGVSNDPPADDPPSDDPPADDPPADDPPSDDPPSDDPPADDPPADDPPADDPPADDPPADDPPADDPPADDPPADDPPADDPPADDPPADDPPGDVEQTGQWVAATGAGSITTGADGAISFAPGGTKSAVVDMAATSSATLQLSGVEVGSGNYEWGVLVHGSVDDSGRLSGYVLEFKRQGGSRTLVVRHLGDGVEHPTALATVANVNLTGSTDIRVTTDGGHLRVWVGGDSTPTLEVADLAAAAGVAGSPHATPDAGVFGLVGAAGTSLDVAGSSVG